MGKFMASGLGRVFSSKLPAIPMGIPLELFLWLFLWLTGWALPTKLPAIAVVFRMAIHLAPWLGAA